MGKSVTINCLGYAKLIDNWRHVYHAMNRLEIAQQLALATRENRKIEYWQAQTEAGRKILNLKPAETSIESEKIPLPKTEICVCNGRGTYSKNGKTYRCAPCNGSGITTKQHLKKWLPWQIEMFAGNA